MKAAHLFAAVFVIAIGCAGPRQRAVLDIATTTSVKNSGLLGAILPAFTTATVRVHAAGSGRSLEMLNDGLVQLVISHAPETEARYMSSHPNWRYEKLAYNRFVIVGPTDDPAHVRDAADALDAFRRIAVAGVSFISRGDGSGTHEREQALWKAAAASPAATRLVVSGPSMAVALRHAEERQGYTLSDEATFWQMAPHLSLVTLFAGDQRLLNTYAVVYTSGDHRAGALAHWLTRGDGQTRIAAYCITGRTAFTVWPSGCEGSIPAGLPCRLPTGDRPSSVRKPAITGG